MAIVNQLLIGILILQINVNAAPSDVGKLEDIAKVEKADESTESTPIELEEDESSTETTRQKRFYNPYGFGFPPINPFNYPNFDRRDDYSNPGNFGVGDPLVDIHRRVQEIANFARQPPPPGIPPHFPVFYPVLFVPPFDCQCNPPNSQPTGAPTTDGPPTDEVTIESRLPNIDDRQNWGIFVNNTNSIEDRNQNKGVEDFRRPISFDPIRVNRPSTKPSPPVEHGTLEGDPAANQRPQSGGNSPSQGNRPPLATRPPPPPPSTRRPFLPPQSGPGPQNSPFNPNRPDSRPPQNAPPSTCDSAILTCCHRPQVTYDCFAIQGCPNFTPYGNPCEPNSILRIIRSFERYYGSVNNGYNY